jgi:hypothetical protein
LEWEPYAFCKASVENHYTNNFVSIIFQVLILSFFHIISRTLTLEITELCKLLNYPSKNKEIEHSIDYLFKLIVNKNNIFNDNLKDNLTTLICYLNEPQEAIDSNNSKPEINIPPAEGIVTQFASRSVLISKQSTVKTNSGWLSMTIDGNLEQVNFDLLESIQTYLPSETITADCKRLLHLSASPPNRDRTTTKNCFRTRRVEVEPTTGRPEKKNYGNY